MYYRLVAQPETLNDEPKSPRIAEFRVLNKEQIEFFGLKMAQNVSCHTRWGIRTGKGEAYYSNDHRLGWIWSTGVPQNMFGQPVHLYIFLLNFGEVWVSFWPQYVQRSAMNTFRRRWSLPFFVEQINPFWKQEVSPTNPGKYLFQCCLCRLNGKLLLLAIFISTLNSIIFGFKHF